MKMRLIFWGVFFIAASAFISAGVFAAQTVTQTMTLHSGWNPVFLEVQPDPRDPATVFKDLPIDSVWTFISPESSVEFIQNPDERLLNQPGWLAYFPDEERSVLTNLHAIFANRAYLIKINVNQDVEWSIAGEPRAYDITWIPDSFNLVGFSVNGDAPPDFETFMAGSTAHKNQPIYDYVAVGNKYEWKLVKKRSDLAIQPGKAYWVYCGGASDYAGPLTVRLSMKDGLDYGKILNEQTVTLINYSEVVRTVSVSMSNPTVPLYYRKFNSGEGYYEWLPLDGLPPIEMVAGRHFNLKVGVRRADMAPGLAEAIMEIKDNLGMRFVVPVSVEKVGD